MFGKKLKNGAIAAAAISLGAISHSANADVLELGLLLDGSGSLGSSGWNLQLQGYKNVFASGSFYDDYIAPSSYDAIWVKAYQFSSSVAAETTWVKIDSNASATAFGNQFNTTQMSFMNSNTNTAGGLDAIVDDILTNGISSTKSVVDISTDGQPNVCYYSEHCGLGYTNASYAEANDARAAGVTVNAIGVGSGINTTFLANLVAPTGFYMTATDFTTFGKVLERKIGREITGVPEPTSIALLGLGLAGIGFARRKSRA